MYTDTAHYNIFMSYCFQIVMTSIPLKIFLITMHIFVTFSHKNVVFKIVRYLQADELGHKEGCSISRLWFMMGLQFEVVVSTGRIRWIL